MRIEDTSPAEFLFGQSTYTEDSHLVPREDLPIDLKLDMILVIVSIVYTISVFLTSYIVFSSHFRNNLLMYLGSIILFQMFLTATKSNILLRRFAPDLHTSNKGRISFVTTQITLSALLFVIIAGLIYVSFFFVPGEYTPIMIATSALLLLIIYMRYFSGIGLVSSALGKGLLPSWGGIRTSINNFFEITSFSGSKQTHLAFLNFGIWGLSITIFYTKENYILLIPFSLLFVGLSYRWDTINASSLLMRIRAHIQEMSPSLIPFEEFKDPIPKPLNLKNHTPTAREIIKNHGKIPRNQSLKGQLHEKTSHDMTTFAVRSLNRIASSIKKEIQPEPEFKFCTSCGREGVKSPENCSRCSREYSRILETFSD